jgi:hypothetical protein
MVATMRLNEGGEYRLLAAAVISQAVRDVVYGSLERRLDALLWLTGPDFIQWADWAGTPSLDPFALLPNLRDAKRRLRRRIAE